jgi:transposase InsO family protein
MAHPGRSPLGDLDRRLVNLRRLHRTLGYASPAYYETRATITATVA